MSCATRLLSQTDSNDETHLPSLDSAIEDCIGELGCAQFFQAVLVSFAWVFDAQQTFISVFTDAVPQWHCAPLGVTGDRCSSFSDVCKLPKDFWEWDRPAHASVVSEWGLNCKGSFFVSLPTSSFFTGCLVGGLIFSTLADSALGRKNSLFLSCLTIAISALFTAFSTNIWIYSALRFLCGLGRATIGTSALVLSTELVGRKWRGQVGVIGFFCFTLGFLSLPALGYTCRALSWRSLYLWTSIPTLFYSFLVHFTVYESPRWLLVRGRKEEAVATLRRMSSTKVSFSGISMEPETWNINPYSSIKILFKKKWAFHRLAVVMVVSFGIGMVYYGMPLGLGSLSFNFYLSVTFNALSELPASLITFFLIDKLSRRSSIIGFTALSGIFSVMSAMRGQVWGRFQIGLELVSFFSACTAFNMLLIFAIELFPTSVRNSAVSMVRQALVLGGVFSPMIAAEGREEKGLSYGVFGVVIGLSGLFAMCLPETRGKPTCDTMEEEEIKNLK